MKVAFLQGDQWSNKEKGIHYNEKNTNTLFKEIPVLLQQLNFAKHPKSVGYFQLKAKPEKRF